MSDKTTFQISIPLDKDGFLRRECPTCEREFKWFHTPEGSDATIGPADGGYFCPYCGVQAQPNMWQTQAQVKLVRETAMSEVVGPILRDFAAGISSRNKPGAMVQVKASYSEPPAPEPLAEDDDMVQVDFPCHSTEPVKVLEDWDSPVHCLICGMRTA